MTLENQELPEPGGSLLQQVLSQAGKSPPVPVLRLRDTLVSLRGSHDWDTLLGLVHSLLNLFGRDQTLLHFLPWKWGRLSRLGEALAQALLAGVLGQGGPGLQGTYCVLTGRGNCSSSADWLSQLLMLFEATSWKPVVQLQLAGPALAREHLKPLGRPAGTLRELSLVQRLLRRMGRSLYSNFRSKASRMTGLLVAEVSVALGIPRPDEDGKCSVGTLQQLLLWGIRHNISWNARTLGFHSGTFLAPPPVLSCTQPGREPPRPGEDPLRVTERAPRDARGEPWLSAEVLEAACNNTVPSLPGISNFTVYLYCSLFNGSGNSRQPPSDLGDVCADSAWYLSSTNGDSLWVRACRARFPDLFNTTVCSNASLLQLPSHSQPLLEELCANLSQHPEHSRCLEVLHGAPWHQEDFWSCFLENQTLWIGWLCSKGSLQAVPAESRAWISRVCDSHQFQTKAWSPQEVGNVSLMEQCRRLNPDSFQQLVCENSSLLQSLVASYPWVRDHCLQSLWNGWCFLLQLLDTLPISSHMDVSRLCRDPASYLLGLVSQLMRCEEEAASWSPCVNYLLRLLDFTLSSSELDEVGQAAREQLSEAILLSSLLDNGSFWASLKGNSSLRPECHPNPAPAPRLVPGLLRAWLPQPQRAPWGAEPLAAPWGKDEKD
uniref:Uncharacterized protein n=1 Tax=Pelusios castaneus TaxID=367368 RepID=A0A8C8RWT8_9SAUR